MPKIVDKHYTPVKHNGNTPSGPGIFQALGATPSENPDTSKLFLYPKSDGFWYTKDENGTELQVNPYNRNFCLNSGMYFWNKHGTSVVGLSNDYGCDRMKQWGNTADWSQIDVGEGVLPYTRYALRSKPATVNEADIGQSLDGPESRQFQGNFATLSAYIRLGSAFQGNVILSLGERSTIVFNPELSLGTSNVTSALNSSTFTRVVLTSNNAVASNTQSVHWQIQQTAPTTVDVNNYIEVSCVQLERGRIVTPYQPTFPTLGLEATELTRYYFSTYRVNIGRGSSGQGSNGALAIRDITGTSSTSDEFRAEVWYPVPMRTIGAFTGWGAGSGTAGVWDRDGGGTTPLAIHSGGASHFGTAVTNAGAMGTAYHRAHIEVNSEI